VLCSPGLDVLSDRGDVLVPRPLRVVPPDGDLSFTRLSGLAQLLRRGFGIRG
jgi:hypothetical protein